MVSGAGEGENRRAAPCGTDAENAACGSRATIGAPAKPDSLRRQSADKSDRQAAKSQLGWGWLRAGFELGFVPGSGLAGPGPNPACFAAYPL